MKLVVGLGNPGIEYQNTRHNIGFMAIDYFSGYQNITLDRAKFKGIYAKSNLKGQEFILLKPLTYMNLSGQSIQEIIHFYKIKLEDILIIYDDLDLPLGKLRLRESGSSGGHNGIKSIISSLATQEFKRIRIGIDKDSLIPVANYVLTKFNKDELSLIQDCLKKVSEAIEDFISGDFTRAMNRYNK